MSKLSPRYTALFTALIISLCLATVQAQDQDQNYIKTTSYRQATSSPITNPTATQATQSVQYFDGLGRPIQQIVKANSPTQHDIITFFTYDEYGKQTKEYLPFSDSLSPSSFGLRSNPLAQQQSFYTNRHGADGIFAFSEKNLERSPLNRVMEQGAPGDDWQVQFESDTDHSIKFEYQANKKLEVKRFEVQFTNANTSVPHVLLDKGFYAPSQLYKTITKDENWQPNQQHPKNHTTEEFKNKLGQVVLKRTYDNTKSHDTYYVYDDYGNLSYVLSPELSYQLMTSSAIPDLQGALSLPWTTVAQVDKDLATAYEKDLADYDDQALVVQDLFNKYGGQGGLVIQKSNTGSLVVNLNMSFAAATPLTNGILVDLKELGTFQDTEVGRLIGTDYSYTLYIKSNELYIEGSGKVDGLNVSLNSSQKLSYQKFFPWYEFIAMPEKRRLSYKSNFDKLARGTDLSTVVVPNEFGATGGLSVTLDETDNLQFVLHIDTDVAVQVNPTLNLKLGLNRSLEDRVLSGITDQDQNLGQFKLVENSIRYNGDLKADLGIINQPPYSFNEASAYPEEVSQSLINGLGYIYRYDNKNNLVEKKIPGKGWEYIVYDKLNRPVLTQDAMLRQNNQWLFTKYDAFGRVAYTGKYTDSNPESRAALQSTIGNLTQLFEERSQRTKYIADGDLQVDYSNQAFPTSNFEIYTVNYYDYYHSIDYRGLQAETSSIYTSNLDNGNFTTQTKTLATASHVRVLGTDQWITSITMYDDKARAIYSHSKNEYLGSETKTHSKLNFIGEVLETTTTHNKNGLNSTNISIVDQFTYDHAGRLLKQTQNINSQGEELIVFNTYDELGQLISKKVGGQDSSNPNYQNTNGLQEIDYSYNIRGWMKAINDVNTPNPSKLFAFQLNYNTPEDPGTTALYNGNISETHWRTQNTASQKRSYAFDYDALNRIKAADYITTHAMTGLFDGELENYSLSNINYDFNGNITNLKRYGANSSNTIDVIDDLNYSYFTGSNQLRMVHDYADQNAGFKELIDAPVSDYEYDVNGNLTHDLNKKISNIQYNHLNLPVKISFALEPNQQDADQIRYTYDATGVKMSKKVINYHSESSVSNTTTAYDNGFIFKTTANYTIDSNGFYVGNEIGQGLQFFAQPEGYVEPNYQGGFEYVYQFKDHLGNVRLSYSDLDLNGAIDPNTEILEETNFYPFGLEHRGYNNTIVGTENNHMTYNGKELNESLGLNVIEMDMRQYDPAIGRFNGIDPLTHYSMGTSVAFDNNPIFWADPSGADATSLINDLWNRSGSGFTQYSNTGSGTFEETAHASDEDIANGKAILIAFPDQNPKIPENQGAAGWLEETFGDGDGKMNGAGHAGIVIIDGDTGGTRYFDFGRYGRPDLGNLPTDQGAVRSSKNFSGLAIPDWDSSKTNEQNVSTIVTALHNSPVFKGYGTIMGTLAEGLDYKAMFKYATEMEKNGYQAFGGYHSSTKQGNATYCAKFARGVAEAGGFDWSWYVLTGKANVDDVNRVNQNGIKTIKD